MRTAALPSQAQLEIDLGAVVANWRGLKARLGPGSDCAAVVKADAYGLGAAMVAPALAAAGCRHFFVAQISEAIDLRPHLPSAATVVVLNGCLPGEQDLFVAHDLLPALNDPGQIETWTRHALRLGRSLPAVLHLDTGMSRLGLTGPEAAALAEDPAALAGISLTLVMSHLARAEEECAMNPAQLRRFETLRRHWPAAGASLANSSGIFLGPAYHFDLARPGAALYGINPLPGRPNPQRDVVSLTAPVLQIREIAPPETVGYGATYGAARPMRVATLACGYADGWPRTLSNRGRVGFAGTQAEIIGRVSMDTITVDASALPALRVGDRMALMGPDLPVDAVAGAAETIGYEILTRLGRRFARAYRSA